MKVFEFLFSVVLITGFVFAPTLGSFSSFDEQITVEAEIKPVLVALPKIPSKKQERFLTIRPTHYGPPDFEEGKPTASGSLVGFGQVAVAQDLDQQVLSLGSTFIIIGIKEFEGIIFEVTDTGEAVGAGQIDFWLADPKLIEALGDQPIAIKVLARGKP
jgi:3D (Asp-Asp-Asp) domain-containing protein